MAPNLTLWDALPPPNFGSRRSGVLLLLVWGPFGEGQLRGHCGSSGCRALGSGGDTRVLEDPRGRQAAKG